jgi:translation initiation factor 2B subunit (eIF-2B alpha/beta/delta family)
MVAAAAHCCGVAIYVLATGDKLAMPSLWRHLEIRAGAPREVWESPPPAVNVENPYFEATPLDLATAVNTESGVLGVDMVPAACAALETEVARRQLDELLRPL